MAGFLRELKRRNVLRVGVAYLVAGWLVIQVVDNLAPFMSVPDWVGSAVLILLLAGFPVAVIIAWAVELTPQGIRFSAGTDQQGAPPPAPISRKWDVAIIVVLAVALGFSLWDRDRSTTDEPRVASGGIAIDSSIAVLPFLNLSSDENQEYFSDGLADELLHKLAKIESLRVASRTSSFTFKGSNDDVQTIAEKLGVAKVLEGSVRTGACG